ncbi:Hypothetical predicted protein [Paramuricea clavata]|uniref:Uncharacterized protein n=1 Tax=Paramuricea clavata TaxID=317549 RepID=A0A7D9DA55_PARCT|nr:Hypothetical predicted protein [Paramuricea clavata]
MSVNGDKEPVLPSSDGKARHFDPDFKGPVKDRSCTDIPCCLIFTLYLIGMVIVGIIAFKEGDLDRLIYPKDSKGNTCGKDFADRKYLFFFDLTQCVKRTSLNDLSSLSCPTPQVCVKKCPTFTALTPQLVPADELKNVVCLEGVTKPTTKAEYETLAGDNKCAKYYVDSSPVLYRCLPTTLGLNNISDTNDLKKKLNEGISGLGALMNAKSIGVKIFEDLKMVWYWILGAFILSMILSLIWIIITRWIAWPMVWFSILASLVLLIVGKWERNLHSSV